MLEQASPDFTLTSSRAEEKSIEIMQDASESLF